MCRDIFHSLNLVLFRRVVFQTICRKKKRMVRSNHRLHVLRNSKLYYLHAYAIPDSYPIWDEWVEFLRFSAYKRLNFLSNDKLQTKVLSRQTTTHFLAILYLLSYSCPISALHAVLTDLYNSGLLSSQLLKL